MINANKTIRVQYLKTHLYSLTNYLYLYNINIQRWRYTVVVAPLTINSLSNYYYYYKKKYK